MLQLPLCRAVVNGECDDMVTTDAVVIAFPIPDPTTDWRFPSPGMEEALTWADDTTD